MVTALSISSLYSSYSGYSPISGIIRHVWCLHNIFLSPQLSTFPMDADMDMTEGHMANTSTHSMNMPSVFSTDTKITIFFTGWTTTSITQYIFTLAFLFFLAIFNRFLGALRFQLERRWSHRESHDPTLHLEVPRKRCYPKAKRSPLPIYTHLSGHSEESLPRPHGHDGGRSDESGENEHSSRLSYKNLLPAWESSGAWSLRKDGTRGFLEFGRAVIGYCL